MTMKVKIEHIEGAQYGALVESAGDPGHRILKVGESMEINMHYGKAVSITEVALPRTRAMIRLPTIPSKARPTWKTTLLKKRNNDRHGQNRL